MDPRSRSHGPPPLPRSSHPHPRIFHARELSIAATEFIQPLVQQTATLLLILAAIIQTLRWRLTRRLRVFGFGTRKFKWFWWLPVTTALAALPLASLPAVISNHWIETSVLPIICRILPSHPSPATFDDKLLILIPLLPAAALILFTFFWLLGFLFGMFVGRGPRTSFRAATTHAFAKAAAPAALILALVAAPLVKQDFSRCLRRDTTFFSPKWGGLAKYEFLYLKQQQDHLIRAFDKTINQPAAPPHPHSGQKENE